MSSVIPLRPLTLQDVYRGAKDVLLRNWPLLLGLGLAVSVVTQLLGLAVEAGFEHDLRSTLVDVSFTSGDVVRNVAAAGTATLLVTIIGFLLGLAVTAAGIVVVHGEVVGRQVPPAMAVQTGLTKVGRLAVMLVLLCGVASLGFLAVFGLMLAVGSFGVVLAFAWLVVCVYFAILFSFASAAIVIEDARVVESLRRSKALVTGGWWRVFGIILLTEIAFSVVRSVFAFVLPDWLASMIVGTVSTPAVVCVTTLLYFDYRIRKEGGIPGVSRMSDGFQGG